MVDNMDLLKSKETEKIWLIDKNGDTIKDNPFYVKKNCLYDANNNIADNILGKYFRGDVFIDKKEDLIIKDNSRYYFINEKSEIKLTKNKNSLLDMFNILIGNVFFFKKDINLIEIKRVNSIYNMIKSNKINIFPYVINDPQNLLSDFLNCTEKDNIDTNPMDELSHYKGIFQKHV